MTRINRLNICYKIIIIGIAMAFFSVQTKGQTPTLIGNYVYSTKGAGAAGVPNFNFNIPSGKNRVMIVTAYFERDHVITGQNYPAASATTTLPIKIGAIDLPRYYNSYRFYGYDSTPGTAYFSSSLFSYYMSDQQSLPTGNTNFSFPYITNTKPPQSGGDDIVISVVVFENASQTTPAFTLVGDNVDFPTYNTNFPSLTSTASAAPVGTTQANIVYVANGAISQENTINNSTDWINIHNLTSTNNLGQNYVGYPDDLGYRPANEADGISMKTIYRSGVTGNPNVSFSRTSSVKILSYLGRMVPILPLARPSISGTVYRDNNGSASIDGGGTGGNVWTLANTLYVNAIGEDGNVLATAEVSNVGVFTFPLGGNLIENDNVRFQLSKNQGTVGQVAPAKELPNGWTTVGESISSGPNDGIADGEFVLKIGATNSPSNTTNRFGVTIPCTNPAAAGTPNSYTKTGISNLVGFGNGWPGNVPNGFIAIESKKSGFVITRVKNVSDVLSPVEGMLVYDIAAACVKLYNGTAWKCLARDCN